MADTILDAKLLQEQFNQPITGVFCEEDANVCYESSREKSVQYIVKLNNLATIIENRQLHLETELKDAEELSKMIESSNPEDTLKIIKTENKKLAESISRQVDLQKQIVQQQELRKKIKEQIQQNKTQQNKKEQIQQSKDEDPGKHSLGVDNFQKKLNTFKIRAETIQLEIETILENNLQETINLIAKGEDYFTKEKLSNADDTEITYKWLVSELDKLKVSADKSTPEKPYINIYNLKITNNTELLKLKNTLDETKNIIASSKEKDFPFEILDEKFKGHTSMFSSKKGFDYFLDNILGDGDHLSDVDHWGRFRFPKIDKEALEVSKQSLLRSIEKKLKATEELIKDNDVINRYREDKNTLDKLVSNLGNLKDTFLKIASTEAVILKNREITEQERKVEETKKKEEREKLGKEKERNSRSN